MKRYPEYKNLDLTRIGNEIQSCWEKHGIFEKSLETDPREDPFHLL